MRKSTILSYAIVPPTKYLRAIQQKNVFIAYAILFILFWHSNFFTCIIYAYQPIFCVSSDFIYSFT
jgi:hypothetical protein